MANANKDPLVYIGPTIPGVAYNGTSYINGLPPAFEEKLQEIPLLRQLLVTPNARPDAQAQICKQSGRFYSIYNAVQTQLGKKGAK